VTLFFLDKQPVGDAPSVRGMADIGFEPDQIFRMIEIGSGRRSRCLSPSSASIGDQGKMHAGVKRAAAAVRRSRTYVLEIDNPDHVVAVNGFTRVRFLAGTGFLMIRRHVLENDCANIPAYASTAVSSANISLDALGWKSPIGLHCSNA